MGYTSDVVIAVAFADKSQRDEVWSVYCMDPMVQKHKLSSQWKNLDDDGTCILWYHEEHVKWYDSYEDVQGVEHMLHLADKFHEEREFEYASIKMRIGEAYEDVESEYSCGDGSEDLMDTIYSHFGLCRELITPANS